MLLTRKNVLYNVIGVFFKHFLNVVQDLLYDDEIKPLCYKGYLAAYYATCLCSVSKTKD